MTPSASGKEQEVARCPTCRLALWSHYGGSRRLPASVRAGTLDERATVTPDVPIFTADKLPWVELRGDAPRFDAFYDDPAAVWRPAPRERWRAMLAGGEASA